MALMTTTVNMTQTIQVSGIIAGQHIVVQILNADNTVAQALLDATVPAGVAFTGEVYVSGTLA